MDAASPSGPAPDPSGRATDRAIALWLAAVAFAVYGLLCNGFLDNADSDLQYRVAARIVDAGTATLDSVPHRVLGLTEPGRGGHQMQFGIGAAVLHLPAVLAGRLAHALTGADADHVGTFLDSFHVPACAAAAVAALFLLARTIGLSRRDALLAALFHGVASYALAYVRSAYYETPIVCLLVVAALLSKDPRRRSATAAAAGALVGFAITIKLVWLIAVPFHLLLLDADSRRAYVRRAAAFLVPVAAALVAVLAWNAWRFGDPLVPGYSDTFRRPLADGLQRVLVSPHASWFLFSPVLVLAVPGIAALYRRDRRLAACTAGLSLLTLFVIARSFWPEGGPVHGPRYLLPLAPFHALAAACFVAERSGWARRACIALACVSTVVQLPALVVAHQDYYRVRFAIPEPRREHLPSYLVVQTVLAREKLGGRDMPYDLGVLDAALAGMKARSGHRGVSWWWVREGEPRGRAAYRCGAAALAIGGVVALIAMRRAWKRGAPG